MSHQGYVHPHEGKNTPTAQQDAAMEEEEGDFYTADYGEGTPLYNAWVIEEDGTSDELNKLMQEEKNASGNGGGHTHPGESFKTPKGRPSNNELWRLRKRGCQDCWAALFFLAFIVLVMVWGVADLLHLELSETDLDVIAGRLPPSPEPAPRKDGEKVYRRWSAIYAGLQAAAERDVEVTDGAADGTPNGNDHAKMKKSASGEGAGLAGVPRLLGIMLLILGVVMAGVVGGMLSLQYFARQLIFVECGVTFALFSAMSILAFASGGLLAGMLLFFAALMPLLWIYLIQDRIPFAVAMLVTASTLLRRHPSLMVLSLLLAVVHLSFTVLCGVFLLPTALHAAAGKADGMSSLFVLCVVFALFWGWQVAANVLHVTTCGVTATWYFAGDGYMPSFPVKSSLIRSITTSFGSICFGSLAVAVVQFLRFLVNSARNNDSDNFLYCIGAMCLACIEQLLLYFNQYAFVHVAVYGCSFVDAAQRTWALTKQCAFSAIFNDCLAQQAVDGMALLTATVLALVVGLVSWSVGIAVVVFLCSMGINYIVFCPVASMVTTLFVCFAEVPAGLKISFPQLYEVLKVTDGGYTHLRDGRAEPSYGSV